MILVIKIFQYLTINSINSCLNCLSTIFKRKNDEKSEKYGVNFSKNVGNNSLTLINPSKGFDLTLNRAIFLSELKQLPDLLFEHNHLNCRFIVFQRNLAVGVFRPHLQVADLATLFYFPSALRTAIIVSLHNSLDFGIHN